MIRVRREVREGTGDAISKPGRRKQNRGGGGNWLAVIAVSGHGVAQQIVDQRRHHSPFNWSLATQHGRM